MAVETLTDLARALVYEPGKWRLEARREVPTPWTDEGVGVVRRVDPQGVELTLVLPEPATLTVIDPLPLGRTPRLSGLVGWDARVCADRVEASASLPAGVHRLRYAANACDDPAPPPTALTRDGRRGVGAP
jgi:hypothetical protein